MSKTIPTIKIELPISKKTIEIYEWMTQGEADEFQKIVSEGANFDASTGSVGGISPINLLKANEYKVTTILANISYQEYSELHPTDRAEVLAKFAEAESKNA